MYADGRVAAESVSCLGLLGFLGLWVGIAALVYLDSLPLEAQSTKANAWLGLALHILQKVVHHFRRDDVPNVLCILLFQQASPSQAKPSQASDASRKNVHPQAPPQQSRCVALRTSVSNAIPTTLPL